MPMNGNSPFWSGGRDAENPVDVGVPTVRGRDPRQPRWLLSAPAARPRKRGSRGIGA